MTTQLLDRHRSLRDASDEDLVRETREGDAEAFGVLIERHQAAVAGFALSLLHDWDAAEEAAQEAFIKAFRGIRSFEGRSSFKTWVSRIALNAARSQMRWARLRRWVPLEAPDGDGEDGWEGSLRRGLPGRDESRALERRLDLERAMGKLTGREKEMTALRLEGFTMIEIAQTLGISVGTVKSTLFDATRKMRHELG